MNTTIDVIGALLSIISAYFYIKEKPIAWLISLIAIPFDVIMDFRIGVYGDLLLQFLYFILLIYGWYSWRHGAKVEEGLPILRITAKQFYLIGLLTLFPVIAVWLSIDHYTDSEVALLDASVTVLSMLAIWLLGKKIIESWLLWVFVDCLYVALYVYKQMPFHAFMSLFDSVTCVIGYFYWMKEYGNAITDARSEVYDESVTQTE
ncbi:MAG TPA: nicotinamide riboside transporter PnuC [Gammaproteobacteria bacterium]|nr:nicotinamide riboside transporter PnuC [Gammaproteobacteria bacterium]